MSSSAVHKMYKNLLRSYCKLIQDNDTAWKNIMFKHLKLKYTEILKYSDKIQSMQSYDFNI